MSFPTNTSSRSNDELAKILWDYNYLKQELKKSDAILVLGTKDTAVAEHGADLFLQGFAPYLIVTGGLGRLTKETFSRPEAEIFAEIAVKKGVPEKQILIENASTNTGENISFTKKTA